ncbi:MAG: gamma-glutamyltransferase [Methyloceanibacter sp.]|nr:gamma-glutamyltransferase [Methyloceanibacter sp.]
MASLAKPAMLPRMMRRQFIVLAFLLLAFGLTAGELRTPAHAFEQPESESGFVPKPLVKATQHMVVAAHPLAAEAGLAILRKGGSAVDAGIATQMVLNLVEPQSSGIGGGGFILYWDAGAKELKSIDGRETAPAAVTPELFLDAAGKPIPRQGAMASGLSVGVPGALAALKLAHDKYGKLPWAELFQPAIALAREGFPISSRLAKLLAEAPPESFAPEARSYFFDAQGRPWPSGYKLANPAFAETLEAIAREGPEAFYEGEIARDIANAVQNDPRRAGKLRIEDLASYRAEEREPVCILYRTNRVCGMGPPSSGGVAVAQTLVLIEPFDLGPAPLGARPAHLVIEAERLALADRARYLADSDFVPVPLAGLLDPSYLALRRAMIDPDRALPHVAAGSPPNVKQGAFGLDRSVERGGTSQISIVDDAGNAFSMTTSIESGFGARTMVRGFLLNNQLTDFSFEPVDEEGRPVANRVEPGKRPRSAMDPTMVFGESGGLRFVLGSPGGPAIILFNVKTIVALIDWGLDPAQAAALVNFGGTEKAALLEPGAAWDPLAAALDAMGHDVRRVPLTSGEHIIAVTPEGLEGGADPRREGMALGD